jgi:hypothetical protein
MAAPPTDQPMVAAASTSAGSGGTVDAPRMPATDAVARPVGADAHQRSDVQRTGLQLTDLQLTDLQRMDLQRMDLQRTDLLGSDRLHTDLLHTDLLRAELLRAGRPGGGLPAAPPGVQQHPVDPMSAAAVPGGPVPAADALGAAVGAVVGAAVGAAGVPMGAAALPGPVVTAAPGTAAAPSGPGTTVFESVVASTVAVGLPAATTLSPRSSGSAPGDGSEAQAAAPAAAGHEVGSAPPPASGPADGPADGHAAMGPGGRSVEAATGPAGDTSADVAPAGAAVTALPVPGTGPATAAASVDGATPAGPMVADAPEQQIVRVVAPLRGRDGTHQISLELRPGDLGSVVADIRIDRGIVHLALSSQRDRTAELIQGRIHNLRSALAEAGLAVGSVEVVAPGAPSGGGGATSGSGRDAGSALAGNAGSGGGSESGRGGFQTAPDQRGSQPEPVPMTARRRGDGSIGVPPVDRTRMTGPAVVRSSDRLDLFI